MKKICIMLCALTVLLTSCGKTDEQEPGTSAVSGEQIPADASGDKTAENAFDLIGREAEKTADSGIKLTTDESENTEEPELLKTEAFFYFGGDKLVCIKYINTYMKPEDAQKAFEEYRLKKDICTELSVSGSALTFYAAKELMQQNANITKDHLKDIAKSVGGEYEDF